MAFHIKKKKKKQQKAALKAFLRGAWNFTFNQLTTYMVHDKTPVKELPEPLKGKS